MAERQTAFDKMATARADADRLLMRCYGAGHREGWQSTETTNEVMADVNDYLSMMYGAEWQRDYFKEHLTDPTD